MIAIDLEMPETCKQCIFETFTHKCKIISFWTNHYCDSTSDYRESGRPEWCPLVEVKE